MTEVLHTLRVESFQVSNTQLFALDNFGALHVLMPDGKAWLRLPPLTVQYVPPVTVAAAPEAK